MKQEEEEVVLLEEEEEEDGGAWDDLSWSGELLLSSRRPPPHPQLEDADDDDDQVAWDQLELDPDPTPAPGQCLSSSSSISKPNGVVEDNDGPATSSTSSHTTTTTTSSSSSPLAAAAGGCRHDQDEHSRWLRETNAFLQEAMVYLVGSIALKTQKDERRALQCFRKAHELGHARGTFRVGLAHLEGTGGVEKGEELAKAYLRESLDQFVSHQIQDSDYYGNFRQYLENDFRHGALRHPLVLDLLQLYAEQSEDIKKVVDFALERNGARRRNITIVGNLPIFGTTAPVTTADDLCKSHEHLAFVGSEPADDETKEGKAKEMSSKRRRAKEEARRERSDKKTAAAADKKEKKRLARADKEREKERRREEKKARRIEKDAARRTKEDERKALKNQPSRDNKVCASSCSSSSSFSSATTTTT